ncbi:hypothetical protein AJ80_08145 [Polytolypa hystricis UAMH7299]|uniref:Protein PXR1 n=1 Tax=Polytolypa hystricis (strain UAMH7299) TaxID=1447883 RepID=A0A2B7XBU9_POLH7|nr:hypothetical protein AJ80_08145 [Polytolypa hystricis UAMH7299]
MGLAGPRKRTKISHDPNNTSWSRSTTGYGHKIMTSQGWAPGSYLGAQNAAHADHFTVASASHIRVVLKDDNLGLGARPKNRLTEDEPTGIDAFQGLLGRLNGKSDTELEKEQKVKEDRKLASYIERRWKTIHFIKGGLLVHEKLQSLEDVKTIEKADQSKQAHSQEDDDSETTKKRRKKEKKEKKEKKRRRETKSKSTTISSEESSTREPTVSPDESTSDSAADSAPSKDASRNKKEKKDKKSKKRKRKELKTENSEKDKPDKPRKKKDKSAKSSPAPEPQGESRTISTIDKDVVIKVREHRPPARQVIRGRYIQQKKMAIMNAKSLNEVWPLLLTSLSFLRSDGN